MSFRSGRVVACWISVAAAALLLGASRAEAQETLAERWRAVLQGKVPHETALGSYAGMAYDWSDMCFGMVSWQALYDYEEIWLHDAPDGLGVRFEGSIGGAGGTEFSGGRLVASGNVLGVHEFGSSKTDEIVPYVEAGIGLIYTDFQREEQAFRLNFNPVAGFGLRMGRTFIVLRAHHLSNADIDDDNRGINSVVLGFGVYLGPD